MNDERDPGPEAQHTDEAVTEVDGATQTLVADDAPAAAAETPAPAPAPVPATAEEVA